MNIRIKSLGFSKIVIQEKTTVAARGKRIGTRG